MTTLREDQIFAEVLAEPHTYFREDQIFIEVVVNDYGATANQAPTANPQSVSTPENTPLAIVLTGSDPDMDTLTFSIVALSGPDFGILTGTPPNVIYTPDVDYVGPDSFDFQVCDPEPLCDTATITITVESLTPTPTDRRRLMPLRRHPGQ